MSRPIPLLLAALTLGLTAAQHQDEARCATVDEEASCRGLGLLEVPSALPLDVGSLDLSGNQLRSVAAFPLGRYALLRRLDLSANAISSVQPGALGALPRLEHLSLARNRLALGPQGALGLPPALRSLDLSGNGLYSGLAERLLGEAPGLRALSLAENSLTRLTPRTFRGLPALERLDLHGNVLLDIEEGAFEALPRLAHLNLSRNSLTCISRFGLPQLRVLDLSRNSIEAFQTAPAPPAPLQLAWLDLRENRLLRFPDLAALPRLAYLNASGNLLRLPGGGALLAPLPRPGRNASARPPAPLLHLDLSSNEIELVPDGFLEPLTSLRFLNLSGNCLRAFAAPRAGTLPGLLLLDLSHNALAALEPGAGALGSLRTLLLRDNALRDLGPRTFSGLAGLRSLDLQGNRLTPCAGLPEEAGPPRGCVSLSGLPALRALNLAGNAMETLPPGAFLRTPLAELDLSRNPGLRVSAGALAGLEASLEALALQGLGLTDLPVDLPRFPRLARLNLAENRLSRLPAWTRAVALEELDLRNNSFRLLPGSAMGGLEPSLRRLYLRGNPLSCCGNAWLAAQLHGGRVRVDATRDLPCRFGARAQLALSRVRPEDCGQQDPQPRGLALLLTLALAAAALLATLATCCCLRRQRFRRRYKA